MAVPLVRPRVIGHHRHVGEYLEVWGEGAPAFVALEEADRVAIGRDQGNDVVVHDPDVSRVHAAVVRFGRSWVVSDLGSTNGTFVNGVRLVSSAPIREGDELRLGSHRLVLRSDTADATTTALASPPPQLTSRERDVLVALCRPLLKGHAFSPPATVREVAAELFVTGGAVKQHLLSLYRKFEIGDGRERRVELANAAIRSGAVGISDLHD